jgi:hypothetical protein
MPAALRRAIAIQRQRNPGLAIQLYDIRTTAGTVVGTYTGVGAHERNYESNFEENNKDVGVSYFLTAPVDPVTPLPLGTVAVVHAHTLNNGRSVEGIAVKKQTAAGVQTPWVTVGNMNAATAGELRTQMQTHALGPQRITNLRKLARETGVWPAGFAPGTNDIAKRASDRETIYYVDAAGWTTSANVPPSQLYDAAGDRLANIYTSPGQAQAAIASGNTTSPVWYVPPVVAAPVVPVASGGAAGPSKAALKRQRQKAARVSASAASAPVVHASSSSSRSAPVRSGSSQSGSRGGASAPADTGGFSPLAYAAAALLFVGAVVWQSGLLQTKPAPGASPMPGFRPLGAPPVYRPAPTVQRMAQPTAAPAVYRPAALAQAAPAVYRPAAPILRKPGDFASR